LYIWILILKEEKMYEEKDLKKKNKASLIETVLILDTEKEDIQKKLDGIVSEAISNGELLKNNPFIPEYLGFTESEIRDTTTGALSARVYSKGGFNISRPIGSENVKWAVMDSFGNMNAVHIRSMYHAIIVLDACGMSISINDYFEDNKRLEQSLMDNLSEKLSR
jgi:hypothetical protein